MSTFCQFHPHKPSTHVCGGNEQPLCASCARAFTVDPTAKNSFAGEPLCPACLKTMVRDNANTLSKNIKTIKRDFIISLVGIVIGLILGFILGIGEGFGSALIFALIGAGIGGMFLSFIKFYLSMMWECFKAMFAFDNVVAFLISIFMLCINMLIGIVKCIFYTIRNTYEYITYLRATDDILKTDAEAVQWVDDYLAYTNVREENPDAALETLMAPEGPLSNNVFAQSVAAAGEDAAIAHVQSHVTLVTMSFHIVHDFDD